MKKCWFSQVLALSAFYSVLTQSEQLLSDEYNSKYQMPEGSQNYADQDLIASEILYYDDSRTAEADLHIEASIDGHAPFELTHASDEMSLSSLTDGSPVASTLSLSDLLELVNESLSEGDLSQMARFFENEEDHLLSTAESDVQIDLTMVKATGYDLNLEAADNSSSEGTVTGLLPEEQLPQDYSIAQLMYLEMAIKALQGTQDVNPEKGQVLSRYLQSVLEELEGVISADPVSEAVSMEEEDEFAAEASQIKLQTSSDAQVTPDQDDVIKQEMSGPMELSTSAPSKDQADDSEGGSREQKLLRQRTIAKDKKKKKQRAEQRQDEASADGPTNYYSWFAALMIFFSLAAFFS